MDDPALLRLPENVRPGAFRALARLRNHDRLLAADGPVVEVLEPRQVVEDDFSDNGASGLGPSLARAGKRKAAFGGDREAKKSRFRLRDGENVREKLAEVAVPGRTPIPQRDDIIRSFGHTEGFYNVSLVCKDDVSVPYIKLWLMEESPVFLAKMQHGDAFTGEMDQICFPDLEASAVSAVLQALNTATIMLSLESVEPILLASDVLGVNSVKDACGMFLRSILPAIQDGTRPRALLEILNLEDTYSLKGMGIRQAAAEEAAKTFPQSMEGILSELDEDFMKHLLSSNSLQVETEMDVFRCIQEWSATSPMATSQSVVNLFDVIRIERLHPCQLDELMGDPALSESAHVMVRINRALMNVIRGTPFPKRTRGSRDLLYTVCHVPVPAHAMDRHLLMERHTLRFGEKLSGSMYVERRLMRGELTLRLMVPLGSPKFVLGMWTDEGEFKVIGDTSAPAHQIQVHGGNDFQKYDWTATCKPWCASSLHLEFRKLPRTGPRETAGV